MFAKKWRVNFQNVKGFKNREDSSDFDDLVDKIDCVDPFFFHAADFFLASRTKICDERARTNERTNGLSSLPGLAFYL